MKFGIAIALMATVDVALAVVGNEAIVPIGPVDPGFNKGNSASCFFECKDYAPNYCETPWVTCNPNKIDIKGTEKVKDFCPVACKDKCDPNPCMNGGTCVNGNCYCSGGCSGPTCEYCPDPCIPNPCQNNGVCVNGGCYCPAGCSGTLCESCADACNPNPCKNGAACVNGGCQCPSGCSGKYCETCDWCALNPISEGWNDLKDVGLTTKSIWNAEYGVDNIRWESGKPWHNVKEQKGVNQWIAFDFGCKTKVTGLRLRHGDRGSGKGWDHSSFKNFKLQYKIDDYDPVWHTFYSGQGKDLDCCGWDEIPINPSPKAQWFKLVMDDNWGYGHITIQQLQLKTAQN